MIFLATTFCSGRNTLLPSAISNIEITAIQIFDGVYNHLYLSSNPNDTTEAYESEWTYDTKLNASFNDGLEAGNSSFSLRTTDHVVIKRREIGTVDWVTIFVKEINVIEDFDIHFKDTYARAGVEYEYRISSYISGVENSYVTDTVYSDFNGYYVTDKDCLYGTIFDFDGCETSRNIANQTLQLLNSKYMSVVSNSDINCDSGSISGTFIKLDEDEHKEVDRISSHKFRNDFKDRLANKKPLILKICDGRIWMIRVTGTPTDSYGGHLDLRKITFEWVEIGDINDMKTLYNYGFSDVDSRWW